MLKEVKIELLDKIRRELRDAIVVVEGARDARALRRAGINSKIITIGGKGADFLDKFDFDGKEVVVLTDFDRRGIELKERVVASLQGRARINTRARALFRALGLKKIEEIPREVAQFGL